MHSLFIGGYWPSRRETKEQCAHRAADFLTLIKTHPEMAQWFPKGKTAKLSTKAPVPVTPLGVLPFLKTNNRDTDGSAISELGFDLNLWNGSSISLSISCGSFSPVVGNYVVLNLPAADEVGAEKLAALRPLLEAIVTVWEPDHAVLTSPQLITKNGGGMPWETRGWLEYHKSEGFITSKTPTADLGSSTPSS
jgi:hypothetical protein